MDFKQLEAFVKVYELKSFSKAAEAIYLSQPSVSAYISALEKELDVCLINRSTKEIAPTKAGKLFYDNAKSMLSLRDKSVTSLKKLSDYTMGDIEIMASSVPAQYILPEILAKFHESYPNITFNVNQADSAEVIKGISSQKAEVGFAGAKTENSKCVFEYLTSDRLIIIAPYTEKASEQSIEELFYSQNFVARETGSGTRLKYEEFLRELGVKTEKLKISACLNNTQSIINAVSAGLGISIVSEAAAGYYIRQKLLRPIYFGRPPLRNIYIVLKKSFVLSPAATVFIDFARNCFSAGCDV